MSDPTESNVLNIPCTQCKTGWMQVVADPRTLEPLNLRCSHCPATQPLPPAFAMRRAGVQPLPGLDVS
jgi:hypothetical protein